MSRVLVLALLVGCGAEDEPPKPLAVGIRGESGHVPFELETALGYDVTIEQFLVGVTAMEFLAPDGAQKAAASEDMVLGWGRSGASPSQGGAVLALGEYAGVSFGFLEARSGVVGVNQGDRIVGHAFRIAGTVSDGTAQKPFIALLDVVPGTSVVNAPFPYEARPKSTEETETFIVEIQFFPGAGGTPFDTVDFFALPEVAGTLELVPGDARHDTVRDAITNVGHYGAKVFYSF